MVLCAINCISACYIGTFFLYEERVETLRGTPRFSTMIDSKLYEERIGSL